MSKSLLIMCACLSLFTVKAVDIELTIQEEAGVTRRQEPCSNGIPLVPGTVMDEKKLRVVDANGKPVPAQFRVLHRLADGSIEWVRVSFLADVAANGKAVYRLTDQGAASIESGIKVSEGRVGLTVVTGPMKAILPRDSFAGLGQVWMDLDGNGRFEDGEQVAKGGGLKIKGADGKVYDTVKDLIGPVTVSLEDQGPVHVVVKIEGTVKAQTADGKANTYPLFDARSIKPVQKGTQEMENADHALGFTARLHFWKGQSWVRNVVTMRKLSGESFAGTDAKIYFAAYYANALKHGKNFGVDAIDFDLDLVTANDKLSYDLGGGIEGSNTHKGQLTGKDDRVVLYQDSSAGWQWQAKQDRIFDERLKTNEEWMKTKGHKKAFFEKSDIIFELMTKRDGCRFMGYRIYRGGKDPAPGSTTNQDLLGKHLAEGMRAPGWLEVNDGRVAVTAGCRWFWQLYPKDLTIRGNGRISLGMWSQYWDRSHPWEGKVHRTHELLIDFRPVGKGLAAAGRFRAFNRNLIAVASAKHNLKSRAYGDFPLALKDFPWVATDAQTAVHCGVSDENTGHDSSLEIEREKNEHYGVWKFGDHAKRGWHGFSQYQELDVPFCLLVNFARTGDMRFYREAEISCRHLLDIAAHGGGYGHQKGESSHYYTTGPLLFAHLAAEPALKRAVKVSHVEHAKPAPWHMRSFAITMWSNLDIYKYFPEVRDHAFRQIKRTREYWTQKQNPKSGGMSGFNRKSQTFFLGMAGDAMGRYCEAFPEDKKAREQLVAAVREWSKWAQQNGSTRKAINSTVANAFSYACRFSKDDQLRSFIDEQMTKTWQFCPMYRRGRASAKAWSEYGQRLSQTYLHDAEKEKHPELYK